MKTMKKCWDLKMSKPPASSSNTDSNPSKITSNRELTPPEPDEFKVHLFAPVNLKGKKFITGFRSNIGQTGYIVIRHLIQTMEAKRIGFIELGDPPPSVFMEDDILATPLEIYESERFVLLFPRLQPSKEEWVILAKGIAEWVVRNELTDAVLIGGLDNRFKNEDEDELRGASTTIALPTLKESDVALLERGLGIYGPLALILYYFEIADFPTIAFLPYAERGRPDPRAASVAVTFLNRFYSLDLDNTKLLKHAKEIETEIQSLVQRQTEEQEREKFRPGFYT
jgi:predicted ATP-grasp superfamily ATP-dependent carboligase